MDGVSQVKSECTGAEDAELSWILKLPVSNAREREAIGRAGITSSLRVRKLFCQKWGNPSDGISMQWLEVNNR